MISARAAITSGTDYVIKNVESGQYLAGGNSWGTQASTFDMPQLFTLTTNGTGFSFDSHQSNGGDNHYMTADLWLDGAATAWTVEEVGSGTGIYTIKNGNNYLASGSKNGVCQTVTSADTDAAKWQIFSKSELSETILSGASFTNGIDATPYIMWPDFKKRNLQGGSPWTWKGYDGTSDIGGNFNQGAGQSGSSYACAESWHSGTGFKATQTITGLKAGVYTLRAHGFYRQDGSDNDRLPYLYAGDVKSYFPAGTATNMQTGYNAFLSGNHSVNPIMFRIANDGGEITIGYANENTAMWNLMGQTQLTYYGNGSIEKDVELTGFIVNHAFETGNIEGWAFGSDRGVMEGGAEIWHKDNAVAKQQITGLVNGKYRITCQALHGEGENDHSLLFAKSGSSEVTASATEPTTPREGDYNDFQWAVKRISENENLGKISVDVVVADGSLEFGFKQTDNTQWDVFSNFTLTYLGEDISMYVETYNEANDNAKGIDQESAMNADILDALQSAITNYGDKDPEEDFGTVAEILEAINALNTAANNANSSITAYASVNISAYLTKMAGVLDNTNVYTTEAYNKWYGNVQTNYDSGLYTNEEVIQLTANGAYSDVWHSNNTIGNILLSSWTIGGDQCYKFDTPLYINTWSVEGASDGSDFLAPFFEYWVSSGSLAPNTIVATVEGLKASTTYSFTIRARVQGTAEKIANGVTMKVGNGETVDISSGTKFSTTDFYIGNFTAVGETDASGKMTMTMTVAANSNISWLSFYNCNYVEGEDLSAYIADYVFARDNAVAAQSKPMDISKKEELDDAIDDYGSLNTATATKSELIEAKEALEDALAVVTPSIAALAGSDLSLWTTTGNNGNFQVNTWSNEGATDGSNMTKPFIENWKGAGNILGEAVMSYEMTDQTPGYYRVRGLVRTLVENGSATPTGSFFFANDALQRVYNGSDCTNGKYKNADVYGYVGDDGVLTIGVKIIKGNFNWVSWKNLSVEYVGPTLTQAMADNLTAEARTFTYNTAAQETEDAAVDALSTLSNANYVAAGQAIETAYRAYDRDYSALISAITEKEGYVLGFLTDEYAPYSGIEAAYATATAIDQNSEATSQDDIDAAATALSSISANATEVNAFRWNKAEDYSSDGETKVPTGGFVGSDANSRISHNPTSNAGLTGLTQNMALMVTTNTNATYGETEGYTLPLKASTVYEFKFKYAGWGECGTPTITILKGNETIKSAPLSTPAKTGNNNTDAWEAASVVFTTTEAGDYKVRFSTADGRDAFGDLELKKASASAKMQVSSVAKMGTFCAPFDVEIPSGVKAYTLSEGTNESWVHMNEVEGTTIAAGTPVLLTSDKTVDTEVEGQVSVLAPNNSGLLQGAFVQTDVPNNDGNYLLQYQDGECAFYLVNSDGKQIGANRCYLHIEESSETPARIAIGGEDGPTGINEIEAIGAEAKTMKDGKYLVKGRIVLVKSGNVFDVNGQLLK